MTRGSGRVRKVGILGCGAIGSLIAKAVDQKIVECDGLILYDYNQEKAESLQKSLHVNCETARSAEEMILGKPAIIVEAASQQAVRENLKRILDANIEVIVMSVGALLDMRINDSRVHTPSGAIGGIDAIASSALAGIDEVNLTTRKSPQALRMDKKAATTVYDGDAEMAVKPFPREMNVAATLALTVRPKKVNVRVISDPKVNRNVHEIRVVWRHGHMFLRFENDPHPDNPGTSALAAWSAIKLLKDLLHRAQ